PSEYGPIHTEWWEGGRLSKEKMKWQLEDLKAQGLAGTWLYPRFPYGAPLGTGPAYWTEQWWDYTRFSLEEQQRLGLFAWVSDWTGYGFFQDKVREESRTHQDLVGRRLVAYEAQAGRDGSVHLDIPATEEILDAAAYQKSVAGLEYGTRAD